MAIRETMSAYIDIYRAQFKATIALQLQYRVALVIWLVYTVIEPIMYLVVWSAVALGTGGRVGGFAPGDFAAYYILTMLVNHITFSWVMHEFEFRIRLGQFSPKLLRPIHPIHSDVADNIGYKLLTLVVLLPATGLLILAFQPTVNTSPWAVGAFIPALLLAATLRFITGWTLAMAAFWTTRVNAVNQAFFLAQWFLSGQMAPLSLLPDWLQAVTWLLPFRWMVSFPVELALGRLTPDQALVGLTMQAAWVLACWALLARVWSVALRRYTAVGA